MLLAPAKQERKTMKGVRTILVQFAHWLTFGALVCIRVEPSYVPTRLHCSDELLVMGTTTSNNGYEECQSMGKKLHKRSEKKHALMAQAAPERTRSPSAGTTRYIICTLLYGPSNNKCFWSQPHSVQFGVPTPRLLLVCECFLHRTRFF